MAKLSVIVPFFNVEPFLAAALESIAGQTLRDIEVIMVDDGSTDGSTVIAKSYAERDPRFRLVQQQNQGLGPARNTGLRHATGSYVAFADGDDVLAPHAYDLLTGSLDETGSEVASGGVRRFSSAGVFQSAAHGDVFRATAQRTSATRFPALLQDCTAWNKVFRRSFFDACGLEFPARSYEDTPVVIRAYALAKSVDVFRDVVYFWRIRESGGLSITQRSREFANIEDRMASVYDAGLFLAERAPRLKPAYDAIVLKTHLNVLSAAIEYASSKDRERMAELALGYLRTVDDAVYRQVNATKRLRYQLLRRGMVPELMEVLAFSRRQGNAVPVVRRGHLRPRWYAAFPYLDDRSRGIPDHVYDARDEMTLNARLDAVTWDDGRLRIEGHAYIRRLDAPHLEDTRIRVSLHNARLHRTIRLPARRTHRPDVTATSNQAAARYDWSGFVVKIDPKRLSTLGQWRAASWEMKVQVRGRGIRRAGPISSVARGSAAWPQGRWLAGNVWVQPAPEHDGRFVIRAKQVQAFVTSCRADDGVLELDGWCTVPPSAGAAVVISRRYGGGRPVRVPVETTNRDGARSGFRARLPVARLTDSPGGVPRFIQQTTHWQDEVNWDLAFSHATGSAAVRLGAAAEAAGARACHADREITTFVTPYGALSAVERTPRLVASRIGWEAGQRLVLHGDYGGGGRPGELLLRLGGSSDQNRVPLTWHESAFTARVTPAAMPGLVGDLPLAGGRWYLFARIGDRDVPVAANRRLLRDLPGYHEAGMHEVAMEVHQGDALRLHVRIAYHDNERGAYAQRRLQLHDYPAMVGRRPLRDLAIFDSFGGMHYSCNPRAIYEELRRTVPELKCAWLTSDGQFTVPDGADTIVIGSRAHYEAMAQARFVVSNTILPAWHRKPDGQVYLQTWHGTPLKRICLDIETPQFASALIYNDLVRADAAKWDALISPNEFSTAIFHRAFAFDGEILQTGYPRNDALHHPGREELAAGVRRQLGLPAGKRIITYAPTWRDDAVRQNGRYRFDLQLNPNALSQALGDDHILLLRLHTNARGSLGNWTADPGVLDVTTYPDITDLLLISDVLITDYSSVMFDFAGTGRPILFFTYDLEHYRDRLRGFYLDFEAEAPGPLLRTNDEVIDALKETDAVMRSYRDAYEAFTAKFCALDDGSAAGRAVRRLLAGQ